MINTFIKPLLTLLFLSLCATSQLQARIYTFGGIDGASGLAQIESVLFNFDTRVEMESLFGEPVINAQIKWKINPSQSLAEIPSAGEDPYETVPLYDLGREAYDKVKIYNVKLQYQFIAPSGETVYLLQDVGVPDVGDGENWSLNVSGSPDWPEVFYRSPISSVDDGRSYYSEDESKAFYVQQLNLVNVTIVSGEVSFFDLQNWYARETAEPHVNALKNVVREIASGIKEAFGLEMDVEKEIFWEPSYQDPLAEGNRIRLFEGYERYLLEKVEKLSYLPKSFQEQGDPDIYFDALNNADVILQNALQFDFQSTDVDVASLKPLNVTAKEKIKDGKPQLKNSQFPHLAGWIVGKSKNYKRMKSPDKRFRTTINKVYTEIEVEKLLRWSASPTGMNCTLYNNDHYFIGRAYIKDGENTSRDVQRFIEAIPKSPVFDVLGITAATQREAEAYMRKKFDDWINHNPQMRVRFVPYNSPMKQPCPNSPPSKFNQ